MRAVSVQMSTTLITVRTTAFKDGCASERSCKPEYFTGSNLGCVKSLKYHTKFAISSCFGAKQSLQS